MGMNFQPFGAAILQSQDSSITVAKQPVLADHGQQLKSAINALPSDLARDVVGGYGEPTPSTLASVEAAILQREFAIEGAANEANLDQGWLKGGTAESANLDRSNAYEKDEWDFS